MLQSGNSRLLDPRVRELQPYFEAEIASLASSLSTNAITRAKAKELSAEQALLAWHELAALSKLSARIAQKAAVAQELPPGMQAFKEKD